MYINSNLYTGADHNLPPTSWESHLALQCGFLDVDTSIERSKISGAMPGKAHPREAMPAESVIAIAIIASRGILDFLVRILVDTGPSSVDRSISRRPVAARRLEHGRLVEDRLVVC